MLLTPRDQNTALRMLRKASAFRSLLSSSTASPTGKKLSLWSANYYSAAAKRFIASKV